MEAQTGHGSLASIVREGVDYTLLCECVNTVSHIVDSNDAIALSKHEGALVWSDGHGGDLLLGEALVRDVLTFFAQVILTDIPWLRVETEHFVRI